MTRKQAMARAWWRTVARRYAVHPEWGAVNYRQGKRRRCFSAVRLTDVLCVTEVK